MLSKANQNKDNEKQASMQIVSFNKSKKWEVDSHKKKREEGMMTRARERQRKKERKKEREREGEGEREREREREV